MQFFHAASNVSEALHRPSLAPVPLGLEAEDVGGGDLALGDGAVPGADDERADVSGGGRGV